MSETPTICAAHPADVLTERAAILLQETAELPAVCVNPPADRVSLEAMVDDLEVARRDRGIARWIFWGISGGGWLGELYARRYPESLSGLILESACVCFRARLADENCILSPNYPSWHAALSERGLLDPDAHKEVGDASATEWIDVPGVGSVFRRVAGPALMASPFPTSDAMRRMMPALWAFDARDWLGETRTPTLVLAGDSDVIAPPHHSKAIHDAIADSEFVVLEGAGHSPVMQRRPDLMEAVRSFIRRRVERV
jgi:non-heme chloroperoxidase